jgi:hypothetical protein
VCSQLGKSLGLSDILAVVEARQSVGQKTCAERIVELASRLKIHIWLARTIRILHTPENGDSHSERDGECLEMRQFLFLVTIVKIVQRGLGVSLVA